MISPTNQDVSNFLGGVYSNPLPLAPQIPGANNIGNSSQNANLYNAPNGGFTAPDANQLQMLSSMMQSTPNSNTNHSVGNGGWTTAFGKPNMSTGPSVSMGAATPQMSAPPNMFGR